MIVLTGKGYNKDLALTIGKENALYCTWIAFDRFSAALMWRTIPLDYITDERLYDWKEYGGEEVSVVRKISSATVPASPKIVEAGKKRVLLWIEYHSGRGRLCSLILPSDSSNSTFGPIDNSAAVLETGVNGSCREFTAAVRHSSGTDHVLIAAEVRYPDRICIELFGFSQNYLQKSGEIEGRLQFHPRLWAGEKETVLVWNEYRDRRYTVRYCFFSNSGKSGALSAGENVTGILSSPGEHLLFPSVIDSSSGSWVLACTAEQPRLNELGSVIHHSEIRVYRIEKENTGWSEILRKDIDYGLNPWKAAYCGSRRKPELVTSADGRTWLLWEMKQDPYSMDPQVGRLLGQSLGDSAGKQLCLIEGRSSFLPAYKNNGRHEWLFASKTRFKKGELDLPYILHRIGSADPNSKPVIELPKQKEGERIHPSVSNLPLHSPKGVHGEWQLFFGDPHCHSSWSLDLVGEPHEIYTFARDTAGLDFIAVTENDYMYLTEPLAPDICRNIEEESNFFYDPEKFTTFNGYEYTKHTEPDSHRCVLFENGLGPIYSWHDDTPTPKQLAEKYASYTEKVLLHPHHAFSLDITHPSIERNIEICSGWANHMRNPEYVEKLHELLNRGVKLGFIGGSDNHERNPGMGGSLTGVWAESNTREGIFEALWNHRTFVTTGLRAKMIFTVETEEGEAFIGESIDCTLHLHIKAEIECCREIEVVEIIRSGRKIAAQHFGRKTARFEYDDIDAKPGEHYYYLQVLFAGKEECLYFNEAPAFGVHGWTSPIWVTKKEAL